ncbi:MAG: hypothetical protein FJ288_14535, partial [Planctomycetes bacterium]|nr:hypothetical protein [Planctomycetota bacterium]
MRGKQKGSVFRSVRACNPSGRSRALAMLMPVAAAALILSAAAPAGAISGVPSWTDAPLVVGNLRDHPDPALSLPGPDFNVYTGAALPDGWTLQASL